MDIYQSSLHLTKGPCAVAKIAGIEVCWACKLRAVMRTNAYCKDDHYDLHTFRLLPALIRKMTEAKEEASETATIWGTGEPLREFMLSDDMARACLFLFRLDDPTQLPVKNARRSSISEAVGTSQYANWPRLSHKQWDLRVD
jgi:nucleoside-diphosphate-sugar epimerase